MAAQVVGSGLAAGCTGVGEDSCDAGAGDAGHSEGNKGTDGEC
jgi:hypothetical protein